MSAFDNVVLIEDNPGDARLVAAYLWEGPGARCVVRQAGTLADGLRTLQEDATDVVLLDLGLPDSQGLAGYVEVSRVAPRTPVVILTGRNDEDDAMQAVSIGAEDYLTKQSIDGPTLLRALRHAVQRRRLTEQLRDSEASYRAIVETAEEGILQVDRDGTVQFMNARAGQILGLPALDADRDLDLAGCFEASAWRAVAELLATPAGSRFSGELPLPGDAAGARWVLAAAGGSTALAAADPGIVLLLTDITDRKRTEDEIAAVRSNLEALVMQRTAQLEAANAQLEAANAELKALSRAMAHDLRTPLNAVIGMTELVRLEAHAVLPAAAWQRLQLVQQSAREMDDLITRLLSMVSPDRQPVQRVELDLSAMVLSIARRLQAAEPQRQVRWTVQPGLTARGDRALVANILQNLLENAWKYTSRVPDAVIAFGADVDATMNPVFFIGDNGVGFDMTQAARLFEPFERLPSARGFAGSGLGLASVKANLAAHGGIAWASSKQGVGSVFYFTLAAPSVAN